MKMKTIKVLLTEDNPGDARLIQEILSGDSQTHFEITHVGNLKTAYSHLKKSLFDVVLLDFSLPDASGLESFIWLYAQAPEVPIIILTGLNDQQLALKAIRKGAQDYLVKGTVDTQHLVQAIHYAIERHHLETELKESEKKYHTIIETANDIIITMNADTGIIINANKKTEELLGLSMNDIVGMHFTKLHPEDQIKRYQKIFLEQVGKGHSVYSDLFVQHKEGHLIPVEVSTSVSEYKGTMILQGIYRDITERKKIEKMKDEFVNAVSHELRTPLTSIREGVSQFLDGLLGNINKEQTMFLDMVLDDVDRLQQIIDELLDISKIESGRLDLNRKMVDVPQLIQGIVPRFEGFLKKDIELKTIISDPHIKIFIDPGKITQVITNLISNAFKFTKDGGKITIELSQEDSEIKICVSDTGHGISEENLLNIFDKFVQANRTDGPGIKGTGLGLPISKGLVEMHGGRIWAESELHKGTRMYFTLPDLPKEIILKDALKTRIDDAAAKGTRLTLILLTVCDIEKVQEAIGHEKSDALIYNDINLIIQENLHRSDDTVMEHNEGLAVFLTDTDRNGGIAVGSRLKKVVDDYLQKMNLTDTIQLRWGTGIYPDQEKYAEKLIEKAAHTPITSALDFTKMRIMVIDDELSFIQIMKIKLEAKGFLEVMTAPNGEKALHIISQSPPDLIILDMHMPVMNGYEVIGRLKTNVMTAKIPVIILSGYPVDSKKLGDLDSKAMPVLSKPMDDDFLFENIETLLLNTI